MTDTCVAILAAGQSSRLGEDKTKLQLAGKSLVAHWQALAQEQGLNSLVVTASAPVESEMGTRVQNRNNTGLGSSIASAAEQVTDDYLLVQLCDNYRIDGEVWRSLLTLARQSKDGLACVSYQGLRQPPVVFHRRYFEFLAKLEGDKGPRELIKRATTYHLSTEPGDIDNKTDLEKFRRWEEAHSV